MDCPASFSDLLLRALRFGDSPLFLRESGETVTYREFYRQVHAIAQAMRAIPARFLILTATDPVRYVEGYLAAVLSGHVACLDQPGDGPSAGFRDLQDKAVITDALLCRAAMRQGEEASALPSVPPEALCTIALSSGTVSGMPKRTGLSQRALLCDTAGATALYRYAKGARCVHILPYWHLFGIVAELLSPLFFGAAVCIPDSTLSAFAALKKFRPDFLQMTPAVAAQLLTLIETFGFARATGGALRKVLISGAPIEEPVCRALAAYGIAVCSAYGLTECAPCVSIMPDWEVRHGTCGRVIDGLTVELATDGEILVQGDALMLGYVADDGTISNQTRDGRLHTGDLGQLSADGYLTVTGRKSSILVLANGLKYAPEPIEQAVGALPHVRECLLGLDCDAGEQMLSLTVVCGDRQPERGEIDAVMQQAGIDLYRCVWQYTPLKRNTMGKLIR